MNDHKRQEIINSIEGANLEAAFDQLKAALHPKSTHHRYLSSVRSKYNHLTNAYKKGLLKQEDYQLGINRVTDALLHLLDREPELDAPPAWMKWQKAILILIGVVVIGFGTERAIHFFEGQAPTTNPIDSNETNVNTVPQPPPPVLDTSIQKPDPPYTEKATGTNTSDDLPRNNITVRPSQEISEKKLGQTLLDLYTEWDNTSNPEYANLYLKYEEFSNGKAFVKVDHDFNQTTLRDYTIQGTGTIPFTTNGNNYELRINVLRAGQKIKVEFWRMPPEQ